MNDQELLQGYASNGSQADFTQIVERHLNLVYSASRRQVRDAHLAQDVTQQVFTLLARRAGRLGPDTVLPAWLYRTARHVASETLRREGRRQRREQLAAEAMNLSTPDATWRQIEPFLDEAMGGLSAADHDAVVLRYFENKNLKEVGAALGLSEDAAQKRVTRALDKLRKKLTRRGVTLTGTTLAAAITGGAIHSAPAGLAVSVATASLAGASAAAATGFAANLLQAMATTKIKLIAAAAAAVAFGTPLIVQYQANEALRGENNALREQTNQLAELGQLRLENQRLGKLQLDTAEVERLRKDQSELLKLRGEVGMLRQAVQYIPKLQEENRGLRAGLAAASGQAVEPPSVASTNQTSKDRINAMTQLSLTVRVYAREHDKRFATNFNQLKPYNLPAKFVGDIGLDTFEFVPNTGPVDEFMNDMLFLRERAARQTPDGKWARVYAFTDGRVVEQLSNDGNFDSWEMQHTSLVPANR